MELRLGRHLSSAPRSEALRIELLDRATALPGFTAAINRLAWSFWRAPTPQQARDQEGFREAAQRLGEWGIYTVPLPPGDRTLAERALDAATDLTPAQRALLTKFIHPCWSVFDVVKPTPDGFLLRDAGSMREFPVCMLALGPRALVELLGDPSARGYAGSVFQVGVNQYVPGENFVYLLDDDEPREDLQGMEDEVRQQLGPILERENRGASTEWIELSDSFDELHRAWSYFRHSLGETGTSLPTLEELCDRFRTGVPSLDVAVGSWEVELWTPIEADIVSVVAFRAWTLMLEELGCPLAPADEGGPEEYDLRRTMHMEMGRLFMDDPPPVSPDDAMALYERQADHWMSEPRREFGWRTGAEVVAEERQRLGTR